jgi:hypothetical protein
MRVLVVDDLTKERFDRIQSEYVKIIPDVEFRHVKHARAVILDDIQWSDVIWLDHDMCESSDGGLFSKCPWPTRFGGCGCKTGVLVAEFIVQGTEYNDKKPFVVIHTANTTGSKRIRGTLENKVPCVVFSALDWSNHASWLSVIWSTIEHAA